MKMSIRSVVLAFSALALVTAGCYVDNRCGKDLVERADHLCYEPPAPAPEAGAAAEGGASEGGAFDPDAGEGGAPAEAAPGSTFGKSCTEMTDCGGDAPICGGKDFPFCTQIMCEPGEPNAGACPEGWQCLKVPPNPSACVKF